MAPAIQQDLVRDIDLLSLDAGNTVIYLDHARLADIVSRAGFPLSADTLIKTEGLAKRAAESKSLYVVGWREQHFPGARGWGAMVGSMLHYARVPESEIPPLLSLIWAEHVELNLWSLVPPDLPPALATLRDANVRVVVVSNSEGMLDTLFARLGILGCFDAIIDSGKVGVEKPDPRIFALALEQTGAEASRTLHLGDMYATDALGARAAGIRTALIDPYGHFDGLHPDVPRVHDAAAVARAIVEAAELTSGKGASHPSRSPSP